MIKINIIIIYIFIITGNVAAIFTWNLVKLLYSGQINKIIIL